MDSILSGRVKFDSERGCGFGEGNIICGDVSGVGFGCGYGSGHKDGSGYVFFDVINGEGCGTGMGEWHNVDMDKTYVSRYYFYVRGPKNQLIETKLVRTK
jgi:hypothetical protein